MPCRRGALLPKVEMLVFFQEQSLFEYSNLPIVFAFALILRQEIRLNVKVLIVGITQCTIINK